MLVCCLLPVVFSCSRNKPGNKLLLRVLRWNQNSENHQDKIELIDAAGLVNGAQPSLSSQCLRYSSCICWNLPVCDVGACMIEIVVLSPVYFIDPAPGACQLFKEGLPSMIKSWSARTDVQTWTILSSSSALPPSWPSSSPAARPPDNNNNDEEDDDAVATATSQRPPSSP